MDRSGSVKSLPPPYPFEDKMFEQFSNNSNTTTINAMSMPPIVAFHKGPKVEEDTASVATTMQTIGGGGGGGADKGPCETGYCGL